MRVARLLIYEGTPEDLDKQLGMSLNDGKKEWGGTTKITIRVVTLPESFMQFVDHIAREQTGAE